MHVYKIADYVNKTFLRKRTKMAIFRKTRKCLLTGYAENLIDEEEFILLYDINTSKNPDFPY